jgi:hypothetical protein
MISRAWAELSCGAPEKEKEIFECIERSYQNADAGLLPREEVGYGTALGHGRDMGDGRVINPSVSKNLDSTKIVLRRAMYSNILSWPLYLN